MFADFESVKEKKQDRILVLKTKDGSKPKSSTGLIDPRLFTGENKLHVIQDKTSLWIFKYEQGGLPEPLRQRFTTFDIALAQAKKYFASRNVEIIEVID
jgi:hypothetical protein